MAAQPIKAEPAAATCHVSGPCTPTGTVRLIELIGLADADFVRRTVLVDISRPVTKICEELCVILGFLSDPRQIITIETPTGVYWAGHSGYHFVHENFIPTEDLQFSQLLLPGRRLIFEAGPATGWRFELRIEKPEPELLQLHPDRGPIMSVIFWEGKAIARTTPTITRAVARVCAGQAIPPQFEGIIEQQQLVATYQNMMDPAYKLIALDSLRQVGLAASALPALAVVLRQDLRYVAMLALVEFLGQDGPIELSAAETLPAAVVQAVLGQHTEPMARTIRKMMVGRLNEEAISEVLPETIAVGLTKSKGSLLTRTDLAADILDQTNIEQIMRVAALHLKYLVDTETLASVPQDPEQPCIPTIPVVKPLAVKTSFIAHLGGEDLEEQVPDFIERANTAKNFPLQADPGWLPGRPVADVAGLRVPHLKIEITLLGVNPPVTRVVSLPANLHLDVAGPALIGLFGWDNAHEWYLEMGRIDSWEIRTVNSISEIYGPYCFLAADLQLAQVVALEARPVVLHYDLSDGWQMQLKAIGMEGREPGYYVVAATGACPPEDCGGPAGFTRLGQILADPAAYQAAHPGEDPAAVAKLLQKYQGLDLTVPQLPPGCYQPDPAVMAANIKPS